MSVKTRIRLERCQRKRRYESWDAAEDAGRLVWQEAPDKGDANPPTPYECALIGDPHYHIGHLRFGPRREGT